MGLKGKSRTFCPQIADTPSLDLASLLVKERGWIAADAARRLKAKLHSETPEVKPEGQQGRAAAHRWKRLWLESPTKGYQGQ